MKLDGYDVNQHDRLFDIDVRGVVTAQVINPDAIICQVNIQGRKVTRTYNAAGVLAGHDHRVLYWQNPLVLAPAKDAVNWRAQCDVIKATIRSMEIYARAVSPTTIDELLMDPAASSAVSAHERGLLNEDDLTAILHELKARRD